MTNVRDLCTFLKAIAPLQLAEEWDNVGLLVGDDSTPLTNALTCLTLTHDVADEAIVTGAKLIVTHHPILFKPVKKITGENIEGRLLLRLLGHEIAVYSPHTAWDNADTGINQQLAELLQLSGVKPLRAKAADEAFKIVTFVPESHLDQVRQAMWKAGAGTIGDYVNCSFASQGVGTFYGTESTNPAVGESGKLEFVDEARLEVVCAAKVLDKALNALRSAHPYEEPAVDVFSIKMPTQGIGSGRVGTLPQPIRLGELKAIVADRLKQPQTQFVGDPNREVQKIGIACGAAAEFLRDAQRAGCDAFVTGEARFHSCVEARDLGIGMILPGHYATERFAMETLAVRLSQQFPQITVTASTSEQDPVR